MNFLKKILKQKMWIFLVITTIIFLSTSLIPPLYLRNELYHFGALSTIIVLILIAIFLILNYKWFGFISAALIFFSASISFLLFKLSELDFSWNSFIAVIFGAGVMANDVIVNLEKIKVEIYKGSSFKKSFYYADEKTKRTILDSNLIISIGILIIFFFGNKNVFHMSSSILVVLLVSILSILIINRFLAKTFFDCKKIKKINPFSSQKNKFQKKIDKTNFFNILKWILISSFSLLIISLIFTISFFAIDKSTSVGISSQVVPGFNSNWIINMTIAFVILIIMMFLYSLFKFGWTYALASVIGIIYDVVLSVTVFIMFKAKINDLFALAFILIASYSIFDTFTIFDRLKEKAESHLGVLDKNSIKIIINESIAETFIRSLYTSLILIISLSIPMLFNGLIWFNLLFIIGIFFGTISSMFFSTWIWMKLELRKIARLKKRIANDFWKTNEIEEQVVKGINNFKP